MLSTVDNRHELLDQAKPYRYELQSKPFTDVAGTGEAYYSVKIFDGNYNELWSGTVYAGPV